MNIKLIAIGKTDNKALQTLIDDYTKRLSFYIKFELEIIPDIKNVKNLSESQQKEKEGELILSKITPTDQLILLDENGKTFSSVGFSAELQKKMNFSGSLHRKKNAQCYYRRVKRSNCRVNINISSFPKKKSEP